MTDPHVVGPGAELGGRIDTAAYLRAAVAHVNGLDPQPDLVVVTGDLTDEGTLDQYGNLAELLAPLAAPYVLLPGNHDLPANLAEVLPQIVGSGWPCGLDVGPLRLVLLDSSVAGEPSGHIGADQLVWLETELAGTTKPTIVAVHHPPHVTGLQHMDAMGLDDADDLGAVIERHPHVVRVISGHLHRNITAGWRGTVVTTTPSTAHQVALVLGGGDARWRREPPVVHLHVWFPDEELLVTHSSPIGDFGPEEPFA